MPEPVDLNGEEAPRRRQRGRTPPGSRRTGDGNRYPDAVGTISLKVTVEVYDSRGVVLEGITRTWIRDKHVVGEQFNGIVDAMRRFTSVEDEQEAGGK